jgi:hypothetical protein
VDHLPRSCELALAELDVRPLVGPATLAALAPRLHERAAARRARDRREAAALARAARDERRRRAPPKDLLDGPSLQYSALVAAQVPAE